MRILIVFMDYTLQFIYTPEGPRVIQSRFVEEGNYISGHESCHPRIGESYPDMGESLPLCIFTAHQSGPYQIARTPEDPLIQDSLSSPRTGLQTTMQYPAYVFGFCKVGSSLYTGRIIVRPWLPRSAFMTPSLSPRFPRAGRMRTVHNI